MKVLIAGTGRMAAHLGSALQAAGITLAGIAGRDVARARSLAAPLGCPAFALGDTLPERDVQLIAVSDDAITSVGRQLPPIAGITAHTSGARGWDLLDGHQHRGVLWPVQSFSAGTPVSLRGVPLVIDAEDAEAQRRLSALAAVLSDRSATLALPQRQLLHIAAVFASNFPVQLLIEARHLLQREGLDPELIVPLWRTTAQNAALNAETALTGPARRGDRHTIDAHLRRLSADADLRRVYEVISDLILNAHHPEKPRAAEGDPGGAG